MQSPRFGESGSHALQTPPRSLVLLLLLTWLPPSLRVHLQMAPKTAKEKRKAKEKAAQPETVDNSLKAQGNQVCKRSSPAGDTAQQPFARSRISRAATDWLDVALVCRACLAACALEIPGEQVR